jgi:hypothetical protein
MTKPSHEETVQIRVSARLKKEIRRSALECDETVRTFVLKALKARGVAVAQEELADRRKATER